MMVQTESQMYGKFRSESERGLSRRRLDRGRSPISHAIVTSRVPLPPSRQPAAKVSPLCRKYANLSLRGCVNPASLIPLVTGASLTQPLREKYAMQSTSTLHPTFGPRMWGLLQKIVRFETYLPVGRNLRGWYVYISKFCYTKRTYLQIRTYR